MKRMILLLLLGSATMTNAQIVNIPDANFKAYLVGNALINTNADAEIQVSEANGFAGSIYCHSLSILNFTGIEAFILLDSLTCSGNSLSTIDLSSNTSLRYLYCVGNSWTSLDVSNNAALTYLNCAANSLTTLDVSNNTLLTSLVFTGNSLSAIDITNNSSLLTLGCSNNLLSSIDVSNNLLLRYLICRNNSLSIFDLSNHSDLFWFDADDNNFADLNIANANNINFLTFSITGNPNLSCIEVDDVAYSTTNWLGIDATTSFSTNCNGASIDELGSITVNVFPNPTSSSLTIESSENIESVAIYNTLGQLVQQEFTTYFSVENLPTGIYMIHAETEIGIIRSRFVKE